MGALILVVTIVYSNFLAEQLKISEERNSRLAKEAFDFINNNQNYDIDITFYENVKDSLALPMIIKTDYGQLIGVNFGPELDTNTAFLEKKIAQFITSGQEPMKSIAGGYSNEMYFFNSKLLDYIRYYPLIQLLLVASFIGLGYYFFNASKRAEQNRVWVGMAKETAHQLGTPISAIVGWLVHLNENTSLDEEQAMVVGELEKDINRLSLVADRFSKIGSTPELTKQDIVCLLEEMTTYMSKRAARKVTFDYSIENKDQHFAMVNAHLFNWVLENLLRNSLDSVGGKGVLSGRVYDEGNQVVIELEDSGKGIPANKFNTIFRPGYSTKKRGWGLGLSLSKRIIEEYHKGKIFVKSSVPNEKTVFCIKLPKKG